MLVEISSQQLKVRHSNLMIDIRGSKDPTRDLSSCGNPDGVGKKWVHGSSMIFSAWMFAILVRMCSGMEIESGFNRP